MLKRGNYQLKKSPLKKISERNKKNIEKDLVENTNEVLSDWEKDKFFYSQIWKDRDHICFESNVLLKGEILSTYFNHILEKSIYPEYRWEIWNIKLVSQEVHEQWHLDKKKCPKMYSYYLDMLEKYSNFENKDNE